jgi:hypothetical protein
VKSDSNYNNCKDRHLSLLSFCHSSSIMKVHVTEAVSSSVFRQKGLEAPIQLSPLGKANLSSPVIEIISSNGLN